MANLSIPRHITHRSFLPLTWIVGSVFFVASFCAVPAIAQVTLHEDARTYTLSNNHVVAKISKTSGDLLSLRYDNLECLSARSGHAGGYWSHTPGRGSNVIDRVTIDPASSDGQRGEVSIACTADGKPVGSGPGGSTICDVEIRYTLGRDDSGIYTYCIFNHRPTYPATSIGEARFCAKLNGEFFDWMTVDANRNKEMISADDWKNGTQLNMKEVRRINTGKFAGSVEHKYDYSAIQFDIPAFGWSSTSKHLGVWFVNPSIEYLSGGATKVELTAHRDSDAVSAPTVLNYWRGSHYGSSVCTIAAGEAWNKVIGPFLIYCNAGPSPDAMWKDALRQAKVEAEKWPYEWVAGVDYPHKAERGSLRGHIVLDDPQYPTQKMSHLLVGLSAPDYIASMGRRGGEMKVDWQLDAKHYEFWTRGEDDGHFAIDNIRPGTYTLHAIADGVLGELTQKEITIEPGKQLDLGQLDWKPIRYGKQIWEIGIPDRSGAEFRHGDHYWQWGLYNLYSAEFPHDVNFIIGQSNPRTDWNYAQLPHDGKPTTWTITFNMESAPSGKATLRVALAATSARRIDVGINGQNAGSISPLMNTATIHRDGIRGYWTQREVSFDASLIKAGKNELTLTIPGGSPTSGVIYDYLRLEIAAK